MGWFQRFRRAVGRFNCRIGDHKYEWRDQTYTDTEKNARQIRSQYRCVRPDCSLHKRWITANVENLRRPW